MGIESKLLKMQSGKRIKGRNRSRWSILNVGKEEEEGMGGQEEVFFNQRETLKPPLFTALHAHIHAHVQTCPLRKQNEPYMQYTTGWVKKRKKRRMRGTDWSLLEMWSFPCTVAMPLCLCGQEKYVVIMKNCSHTTNNLIVFLTNRLSGGSHPRCLFFPSFSQLA